MGMIVNPSRFGSGGFTPIANATYLDSGDKASTITLSNSNLTATKSAASGIANVYARHGKSSGKWRFEVTLNTLGGTAVNIGVAGPNFSSAISSGAVITGAGEVYANNSGGIPTYLGSDLTAGETITFYVDLNANLVWFERSTGVVGGGDPAAGTGGVSIGAATKAIFPCADLNQASSAVTFNFGGSAWARTGSSGFSAWDDTVGLSGFTSFRTIRMYIRSTGNFAHAMAEWEVMASSGGANLLTGGTPGASHSLVGGSGALTTLFDGLTNTWAGINSGGSGGVMNPGWFDYDFGSNGTRNATHLAVRGRDGGGGGQLQAPTLFDLWTSTDDTIFWKGKTGCTFSTFAATTPGQRQELTL